MISGLRQATFVFGLVFTLSAQPSTSYAGPSSPGANEFDALPSRHFDGSVSQRSTLIPHA